MYYLPNVFPITEQSRTPEEGIDKFVGISYNFEALKIHICGLFSVTLITDNFLIPIFGFSAHICIHTYHWLSVR